MSYKDRYSLIFFFNQKQRKHKNVSKLKGSES